ncbi:MAG: DNA polymerase III subunit alpha, partial [Deltaproteobacteria bacterium]
MGLRAREQGTRNMSEFTHLHLHTTYSLLDGAIRIPKLVDRLAGAGMSACAMTDHGNLFGAVEFYKAMKRNGMKPIIGCEGYVAPKGRKDRSKRLSYHMVFLAENQTGYRNLMYLVSMGYKEGFYYNPRVDKELLRKHSEGIIATSACLGGELAQLILAGRIDEAREAAREYKSIFAPGRYFLEIQENKLPEQQRVNEVLLDFSKELDIPLVATNDSHYLQEEDAEAHDVLLCIQTRKKITDEDRLKHPHSVYYVRTPEEIAQLFSYAPEAVANTMRIAEMCNVELSLNKDVYLPEFPVPSGETVESYLRKQAREGLDARLRDLPYRVDREAYRKRLERELEVIVSMGFSGYFLIVADFIQFAKRHQIPVGPGRGSGAGSLVAYALRITDLDPIRYNLIFERFLNPERVSMPDFDVDFCMYRRGEVIDYVKRKYGPDHVCGIIAMSTLKAKGVIRDVARAMGFSVSEGDRIARLIPEPKMQGQNVSIAQALEEEPRLREEMARNPQVRKLIEYAQALEGLNRHAGCHAAGIVISDVPIWERVPIYRMNDGTIVTQFDKNMAEEVGLVKFDFLGLTTLTIIDTAVRLINRHRKEPIDISKIPIDDPKVYELISSGDTDGIFQLETSGLTDLMKKLKPS